MSKKDLHKEIKESDNEVVHSLAEELDTFAELDVLAKSKGGKILVDVLMKDIVADIEAICFNADTFTQQQFIAHASRMKERINLVRILKRATKNKEFLTEEIQEALEDTLQ